MSVSSQSRRFDGRPITSPLPQIADIFRTGRHVSRVPTADPRGWPPHRKFGAQSQQVGAQIQDIDLINRLQQLKPKYRMTAAFRVEDRSPDGSIRFACPGFNRFISWPLHRRHLADRLGMTISRSKASAHGRVLCEVRAS